MRLQFFIGGLWVIFVSAALHGFYPVVFWLLALMVLVCAVLNEARLSK